jgi:hypothetical protein
MMFSSIFLAIWRVPMDQTENRSQSGINSMNLPHQKRPILTWLQLEPYSLLPILMTRRISTSASWSWSRGNKSVEVDRGNARRGAKGPRSVAAGHLGEVLMQEATAAL